MRGGGHVPRITCPANATAITPPPLPRRDIPPAFAPALEAVLGHLPATAGLPEVRGSDVGVALFARTDVEDTDCMMGRRVGGVVRVWSLSRSNRSSPSRVYAVHTRTRGGQA
ncbi:hypothetical protein ACWEVP_21220 [Amycolatopsis sp. NPDC003865]